MNTDIQADSMKSFLELKNVTIVKNLDTIINQSVLFSDINNIDENLKNIFNYNKNTLFLFDSEDYNSAFVHEWYLNSHINGEITSDFNVIYIESTSIVRQFIKRWHKEINNIPVEDYDNKKYEIFLMAIVNDELLTKSDDFDIINQNTILDIIDIFNES